MIRHWLKPFVALTLLSLPLASAQSRVFTGPGWYMLYWDGYEDEEWTASGPFASEADCKSRSDKIAEDDEWYMFADDYGCFYLNQALSNDN